MGGIRIVVFCILDLKNSSNSGVTLRATCETIGDKAFHTDFLLANSSTAGLPREKEKKKTLTIIQTLPRILLGLNYKPIYQFNFPIEIVITLYQGEWKQTPFLHCQQSEQPRRILAQQVIDQPVFWCPGHAYHQSPQPGRGQCL